MEVTWWSQVVALLLGMQLGYIKYCCFLCKWDSRDKKNRYVNKLWHKRTSLTPGAKNVVSPSLVLPEKICLRSLHIKFGPHEKLFERCDKNRPWIRIFVRDKFPNVTQKSGLQIREVKQDRQFADDLNETERNAWLTFKRICKEFLENQKAAN